jgi:hypothetical protein
MKNSRHPPLARSSAAGIEEVTGRWNQANCGENSCRSWENGESNSHCGLPEPSVGGDQFGFTRAFCGRKMQRIIGANENGGILSQALFNNPEILSHYRSVLLHVDNGSGIEVGFESRP